MGVLINISEMQGQSSLKHFYFWKNCKVLTKRYSFMLDNSGWLFCAKQLWVVVFSGIMFLKQIFGGVKLELHNVCFAISLNLGKSHRKSCSGIAFCNIRVSRVKKFL